MLLTLSQSKENDKFRSKNEERKLLSQLNTSPGIRFHLEGSINTAERKCFLLYQSAMSCILRLAPIRDLDRELGAEEGADRAGE